MTRWHSAIGFEWRRAQALRAFRFPVAGWGPALILPAILAALLAVPGATLAQVSVQEAAGQVTFHDVSFRLPAPGWQRDTSQAAPNQPVTKVVFVKEEPLHRQFLSLAYNVADATLSPAEVAARSMQASEAQTRRAAEQNGAQVDTQRGEHSIGAVRYTTLAYRIVPRDGTPILDSLGAFVFPADFAARARYYVLDWGDSHSATTPAKPPDDLDAVIASMTVRPLGEVLYQDAFEDPAASRFPKQTSSPEQFQVDFVDGEYQMLKVDPESSLAWIVGPGGIYSHTLASVDVRVADDSAPTVHLLCRTSADHRSGYDLVVSPAAGQFSLGRRNGDQPRTTLVATRASDAILRSGEPNHLELRCAGNTVGVSINGTPVAQVRDGTYLEGRVYIEAGTSSGTTDVRFDNFVIAQH